ncbi:alginate export family protein [Carboxylicivirga marina]|uniref:Alginate export family protein n=1 Tax=Carboxylicivirga marina TaxID=2800988 RepID=A0ABS1HEJ9_9BACT|nr:alginate export family protein [Carboxylicivirga marina]MBK3516057.1 alginate export family protein [Carboxylicivirga marina]
MNKKILVVVLLLSSLMTISTAQVNISGELRSRGIVDHGFKVPVLDGTDAKAYFDQRTRVQFDYSKDKYSTRITLQDARMWGGDDIVNKVGAFGNSNSFGLYEAWVKLNVNENSSLKIGRQEWNYDDMRILSFRDWLTAGQSYDGLLYELKSGKSKLDIGLSYNNDGSRQGIPDNSDWNPLKLKTMNFIRLHRQLGSKTSIAAMATLSGRMDTTKNNLLATGTHGINLLHNYGKKGNDGFLLRFSAYYQHGTDVNKGSDNAYKGISAYLLSFEAGVRTLNKKLELKAGAELISGHDYKDTDADYQNTRHTFDMQYSAILPYYGGNMNHFVFQESYKLGTKSGGYFDPFIKAKYRYSKKGFVEAAFFFPYLTTDVRAHATIDPITQKPKGGEVDENGNPVYWKGNLGRYFDVKTVYQLSPDINLKAGFSYGIVSDIKNQMVYGYKDAASKELHDMGNNYFGWIMLTVKPKFL